MTNDNLETMITRAVMASIESMGVANFRMASFFVSNRRPLAEKKKAA